VHVRPHLFVSIFTIRPLCCSTVPVDVFLVCVCKSRCVAAPLRTSTSVHQRHRTLECPCKKVRISGIRCVLIFFTFLSFQSLSVRCHHLLFAPGTRADLSLADMYPSQTLPTYTRVHRIPKDFAPAPDDVNAVPSSNIHYCWLAIIVPT
jgi:hypothetical protein